MAKPTEMHFNSHSSPPSRAPGRGILPISTGYEKVDPSYAATTSVPLQFVAPIPPKLRRHHLNYADLSSSATCDRLWAPMPPKLLRDRSLLRRPLLSSSFPLQTPSASLCAAPSPSPEHH
eukprot:391883-Rhodomonas_salina.4